MEKPVVFILDVDGVMTDGKIYQTSEGKLLKVFGPDDHDALTLLRQHLAIHFVTGDQKGFEITQSRIVRDMKMSLDLVSTIRRVEWIQERWDLKSVIYMGDGIFDPYVFREVGYSIAPANADDFAKKTANFVTKRCGGDRAVSEACLHILEKFFEPFDRKKPPQNGLKMSGAWSV